MTKTIITFTLFILTWNICYSQTDCDFAYRGTVMARSTEWNQFKIHLESQLREVKNQNDSIIIVLDTNNWIIQNNYGKSQPYIFGLTYKDSIVKNQEHSVYYINNLSLKTTNFLMTSLYNSDYSWNMNNIQLKRSSAFYNVNLEKKLEIFIYDFEVEKRYDISTTTFGSRLGYSDSAIYVYVNEKRANISGIKFRKGDIVSISKSGAFRHNAQILNYIYPPDSGQIFYQQFYNGSYLIKSNFVRHEFINCEHIYYYKYYIYDIGKKIIDSLFCKQIRFGSGNLPEIKNNHSRLVVHNQDYFKMYSNDGNIYTWTNSDWIKNIPLLETVQNKSFLLHGDTLYVVVETPTSSTLNSKMTLNNMTINRNSTHYQTILAFDIFTNRFIGYPTIRIDN